MRRLLLAGVVAAAGLAPLAIAFPAHAATHGCISVAGLANISGDTANGNVSGPCSFVVVDGDTFSGVGPFTVSCGAQNESVAAGAIAQQTPITCAAGSTATVDATAGGIVAAGNVQ